jgi:light-regulated signal transduction histidine kinase (bacteriophytochrome)
MSTLQTIVEEKKAANVVPGKQRALRLLLLEEDGTETDPTVWEMEYDEGTLPGNPRQSPQKLHAWLEARKICPCVARRFAEGELAHKMQELARSNHELEQFAYVASHDLREPLRMVATYTQLLAERYRGQLDKTADQYIEYASNGALRMQALIRDLLVLSRVGREGRVRQSVDCNAAMEEVLANLRSMIQESGAIVSYDDLPEIVVDPLYLLQVFQNLVANAIQFRKKQAPAVSVLAEPAERFWTFSVTDNGIGIAPESQARIFEIFHRLNAPTEFSGNGIGLAICKKIVEHYGGRIWVESRPGFGSCFKFTLPAGRNLSAEAAQS